MGICTMQGIIRDFAGPYFVSVSRCSFQQKQESPADATAALSFQDGRQPPSWILSNQK